MERERTIIIKKNITKLLSVIMCLALCLCFSVPALALNETSLTNDDVLSDDYIENLQSFYASARFKENYSTLMVSRSTQTVQMNYPENFGGIYIDNENKLHIAYVDGVDALDDSMQDYEVKYDVVKYSFNYLCQISSLLSDKLCDPAEAFLLSSNGLGSLNKILNNLSRTDLLEFGDGKRIKKMQVGKWDIGKSSIDYHSLIPKM